MWSLPGTGPARTVYSIEMTTTRQCIALLIALTLALGITALG